MNCCQAQSHEASLLHMIAVAHWLCLSNEAWPHIVVIGIIAAVPGQDRRQDDTACLVPANTAPVIARCKDGVKLQVSADIASWAYIPRSLACLPGTSQTRPVGACCPCHLAAVLLTAVQSMSDCCLTIVCLLLLSPANGLTNCHLSCFPNCRQYHMPAVSPIAFSICFDFLPTAVSVNCQQSHQLPSHSHLAFVSITCQQSRSS